MATYLTWAEENLKTYCVQIFGACVLCFEWQPTNHMGRISLAISVYFLTNEKMVRIKMSRLRKSSCNGPIIMATDWCRLVCELRTGTEALHHLTVPRTKIDE